jgi:predicted nuclease of predicted toxin-antitoxin system
MLSQPDHLSARTPARAGSFNTKPQVVWLRFGNSRKAELERRLGTVLPLIIAALRNGDRLVEVS